MESAKLLIIILIVALIILIVGAAIWFGWGGTGAEWYSQIDNSCVKEVAASDDMVYEYTLVCRGPAGPGAQSAGSLSVTRHLTACRGERYNIDANMRAASRIKRRRYTA